MSSKGRMANQRIQEILDYIDTPTSQRDRSRTDPYYYGMTEQQWLASQDQLHRGIQTGQISESTAREILRDQKLPQEEIDNYIRDSRKRTTQQSRAVTYGTPHVQTGEILASKVLNASGMHTVSNNAMNSQDTDLKSMIDRVRQLVDVQYRINDGGARDLMALGTVQGLSRGAGLRAWNDAPSNRTLSKVIDRAVDMSNGRYHADKLLHNANEYGVRPGLVKDYLITGHIGKDKINNLHNNLNHGNWNATAPDSFTMVDMNKLSQELQNMTVRDLKQAKVEPIRQAQNKLKLNVPFELVQRLSQRSDIIDPEINDVLRRHYA